MGSELLINVTPSEARVALVEHGVLQEVASDIVPHTECVADVEKGHFVVRDIAELVRQGQDIMVQVVKDPLGTKGARLTTDITLPSRYLVFMPGSSHVGVSQRIEQEEERSRLKKITLPFVDEDGGFIIRTAAEGVGEDELAQDAAFLRRVWSKVSERRQRRGVALCATLWEPN